MNAPVKKTRTSRMPIEHFECSVWSLVKKRSGWDGVYPQSAKNSGVHAEHKTYIRQAYGNGKSMVVVAGGIITDLKKYGARFNSPTGGAA